MLDDREPEPGPARRTSPVAAVEAFEEPGQLLFLHSSTVVADLAARRLGAKGHRRSGARIANRVLREVLDDVCSIRRRSGNSIPGSASTRIEISARSALSASRALDLLEDGPHLGPPEGYDLATALELREKEDVVHELGHLLDLLPRLGKKLVTVGSGKSRRLENRRETVPAGCEARARQQR